MLSLGLLPIYHAAPSPVLDIPAVVHVLESAVVLNLFFADGGDGVVDGEVGE